MQPQDLPSDSNYHFFLKLPLIFYLVIWKQFFLWGSAQLRGVSGAQALMALLGSLPSTLVVKRESDSRWKHSDLSSSEMLRNMGPRSWLSFSSALISFYVLLSWLRSNFGDHPDFPWGPLLGPAVSMFSFQGWGTQGWWEDSWFGLTALLVCTDREETISVCVWFFLMKIVCKWVKIHL